jgi:hypothetical protein
MRTKLKVITGGNRLDRCAFSGEFGIADSGGYAAG